MSKRNFIRGIVILFIAISLMANGYFIRNALKSLSHSSLNADQVDSKVLNLLQVAEYLGMSENDIKGIIKTEKNELDKTGRFMGRMFPYFIIDNKEYFYKNEIDEWLKDVSNSHRVYNITEGRVSQ